MGVSAVSPLTRRIFLAGIAAQVGIVVTGGLVRLTGSGLGCPTWPRCDETSWVPRDPESYHKLIEFGNRTLTGIVGGVALLSLLVAWRVVPRRRSLVVLAAIPLAGVGVQAVLGGITVLTTLHPATVAAHFLVSMILIGFATALYERSGEGDGPPIPQVRGEARALGYALLGASAAVLTLGTVVTGSGPHSGGDEDEVARFGFDPQTVSWIHADLVWLFLGLLVGLLVVLHASNAPLVARRRAVAVLGVAVAQGGIGYFQYWTDLPVAAVSLHMLGASLLVITVVRLIYALRVRQMVAEAPTAVRERVHSGATPKGEPAAN